MEIISLEAPAPFRLGYIKRPRGGDWLASEFQSLTKEDDVLVVSALEPHENKELGLDSEGAAAADAGVAFLSLPMKDRAVPDSVMTFRNALAPVVAAAKKGTLVLVHCRQSIGRASLVLAALLVELQLWDDEGWRRLESSRGRPVPDTDEQREWLRSYVSATSILSSNRE